MMFPGTVTRIIMRFTVPQIVTARGNVVPTPPSPRTGGNGYVWHCHILEHEEHDMMRPLVVVKGHQVELTIWKSIMIDEPTSPTEPRWPLWARKMQALPRPALRSRATITIRSVTGSFLVWRRRYGPACGSGSAGHWQ